MLIQALCDYYEVLAAQGKLVPDGYSQVKIHYLVSLTPEGKMDGILDCRRIEKKQEKNGKEKEIKLPLLLSLPKRTEKTGIESNIVEHRPLYLFGLNYDAKTGTLSTEDKTQKAKKSHLAFVEANQAFFETLDSPLSKAYLNFVNSWEPEQETENVYLLALGKELLTSGFAFILSGHPETYLHDLEEVRHLWDAMQGEKTQSTEKVQQCGILGETLPIARIHQKIKGVPSGSSMGNTLISFKNPAEWSYGQEQGYNSNISEKAMQRYTEALNYLMGEPKHRTVVEDMILFHWATDGNEIYDGLFDQLIFPTDTLDAEHTESALYRLLAGVRQGKVDGQLEELSQLVDPNVTFYIVCIKPNATRLAVKFLYRQSFGELFRNLQQHQQDLKLSKEGKPISLKQITKEMVSPKSSNATVDSALLSKILESALYGWNYPTFLLQTMVRRIQTDKDDEKSSYIQMNDTRIGILKACINRNDRMHGKKEEIQMALDTENRNPAYLCGRLFAVLEEIQQKASGYGLNRTIKDAYFTSASAKPALVFPKLLRLSQHHLEKLDNKRYEEETICEIVNGLAGEFPITLSLKEQGIFMIGYYQQKQDKKMKVKAYKEAQK